MSKSNGYLPLPDCVTIQKSPIHGLGLFATKDIPEDTDLGITHINDNRFTDSLIRTPLGGFLNHSFTPNCKYKESDEILNLVTVSRIEKGEELTVDYSPWYDEEVLATFN